MKQIYDDLWQTKVEIPFGNVNTHAYLLKCDKGNVLFYNTSHTDDIEQISQLGGIKYQYLSHRDEGGESLQKIKHKFNSLLCCHIKEEPFITSLCPVDITFSNRVSHFAKIEVIPTPGHTSGSISFLYQSPYGGNYLFTGDTFFQSHGHWQTIFFRQAGGSTKTLIKSLLVYKKLNPDVVFWSASDGGDDSFAEINQKQWLAAIDNQVEKLKK